ANTAPPQEPPSSGLASGVDYTIRSESVIGFIGSKVTGSHVGGFRNFDGTIQVAEGRIVGTPTIRINMDSLWAANPQLEKHLKSEDFFDVERHPTATFTATVIRPDGEGHSITGNLDLHGVTRSISFPADVEVTADSVTLKAEFAINRKDFEINYPGKPDDLIRDLVVIKLDVKATPGPARPEDMVNL